MIRRGIFRKVYSYRTSTPKLIIIFTFFYVIKFAYNDVLQNISVQPKEVLVVYPSPLREISLQYYVKLKKKCQLLPIIIVMVNQRKEGGKTYIRKTGSIRNRG